MGRRKRERETLHPNPVPAPFLKPWAEVASLRPRVHSVATREHLLAEDRRCHSWHPEPVLRQVWVCPKEPQESGQELPGEHSCLCLAEPIPSRSSCQQMPFPGSPPRIPWICHPASPAEAAGASGRSHPAPAGAASRAHPLLNAGVGMVGECAEDTVLISLPPPESMDCNRRPGFYYDELVKNCIKCSSVCGQHPKECAPSCERESGKGHQNSPTLSQGISFPFSPSYSGFSPSCAGVSQAGQLPQPGWNWQLWIPPGRALGEREEERTDLQDLQILHWG